MATEAPTKTPVKDPVKDPAERPDPDRFVREICPQQTRRWTAPWIIFPGTP